jgi:hypothetical protein
MESSRLGSHTLIIERGETWETMLNLVLQCSSCLVFVCMGQNTGKRDYFVCETNVTCICAPNQKE